MRFLEVISGWANRYFSNEEAIFLVLLLVGSMVVLATIGGFLAPVLTGLVFAFLLQGVVARLVAWRVPHLAAVVLVFLLFLGALIAIMVWILPLIWRQLYESVNALPGVIDRVQELAQDLSLAYPGIVSENTVNNWLATLNGQISDYGAAFLQTAVGQVPNVFASIIYLILVPISVFFFLKDREKLMTWFSSLLPTERPLLRRVGAEMNVQIANYVRGKFVEIVIAGVTSYAVFALLGLNFAALLGLIVGVSVLVPYVGAAVATFPVAAVALLQFGWSIESLYVLIAYGIIQALDGNVLVPLLFSEAVDLHPITIIVAVLAFGGLWGLWGVFFAIPLATFVKAVYNAWPHSDEDYADAARDPPRGNPLPVAEAPGAVSAVVEPPS